MRVLPNLGDFHFHGALDVAAYAEHDWLHPVADVAGDLAPRRRWGVPLWVEGLQPRLSAHVRGVTRKTCFAAARSSSTSLVLTAGSSSSPAIHGARRDTASDEGDGQAFVTLRRSLDEGYGITLLDVMVFDQEFHWWSLHELTSGSTTWS